MRYSPGRRPDPAAGRPLAR